MKSSEADMSKRGIIISRAVVLVIGAVLTALGILRGELAEIMQKGATICLECIGIG
jgi:Fe2+ transport system protein FeoA